MLSGRQNEIEEIVSKNITEEARETAWARSSRFHPGRMPGFSLDRSDHGIRSEIFDQIQKEQKLENKLLDAKDRKVKKLYVQAIFNHHFRLSNASKQRNARENAKNASK